MEEHVEAVQRMQEYIEEHLEENISMGDLARVSLFSPWYSYRIFVRLLDMTPAAYIRKLRLARSALRLRGEKIKILDVALDAGYESVDGYQRAFKREFGCNPYQYSVSPRPIYLFKPYGVKYRNDRKDGLAMKEVKNVFIQVVEKPAGRLSSREGRRQRITGIIARK